MTTTTFDNLTKAVEALVKRADRDDGKVLEVALDPNDDKTGIVLWEKPRPYDGEYVTHNFYINEQGIANLENGHYHMVAASGDAEAASIKARADFKERARGPIVTVNENSGLF